MRMASRSTARPTIMRSIASAFDLYLDAGKGRHSAAV